MGADHGRLAAHHRGRPQLLVDQELTVRLLDDRCSCTPLAFTAFAGVGAADTFDPMVPIVTDGTTTFRDVAGVDVRLTTGDELPGIVLHEAG